MNDSNQHQANRSSVDPGILEMGASVSVNDELRRNIMSETADIEHTCTKLVSDVTSEEDRANAMQKSKHHADKEQSSLIQSTREMSDTNHMNNHIFLELKSKVESEILFSSPQMKHHETPSNGTNIVTPTDVKLHSSTSVFAIQQINNENQERIMSMCNKLRENVSSIQKLKKESDEMTETTNMIYKKVKSEHLKVVLANAKHKVQLMEDILKDKQMHHHANKVNCEKIEAQNKTLQDQVTALENEMTDKKQKLAELQETVRKSEAKIIEMKLVKSNKDLELKKELKYLDETFAQLAATFHEADALIKKRNETKGQFDQLRIDRGASFTSKMSLQSEITAMHKKLESDRRTIHEENTLSETIMKSMKENLEMDQKKAELETLISKHKSQEEFLKSESFPGKNKLMAAIQEQKEELTKTKSEISRTKMEIEEKGSTLKEQKRLLMDHRDEYENIFIKMKTQITEEKETFDALERQNKEASMSATPDEYGLILRNVKLYKYAEKMLQASIAKETKLAEMLAKQETRNVPL